jgi:hypothetical protein
MKTSHSPLNPTYNTEACYRSKLLPLIYKLNTVIQIQKSQIYKIPSISFQETWKTSSWKSTGTWYITRKRYLGTTFVHDINKLIPAYSSKSHNICRSEVGNGVIWLLCKDRPMSKVVLRLATTTVLSIRVSLGRAVGAVYHYTHSKPTHEGLHRYLH